MDSREQTTPIRPVANLGELGSLLRYSIITGMSWMIVNLAGLVLLPLYTRSLSITEMGQYEMLKTLSSLGTVFFIGGFHLAYIRGYCQEYRDREERDRLLFTALLVTVIAVLGMTLLASWRAEFLSPLLGVTDPHLLRLVMMALVPTSLQILYTAHYRVRRRFGFLAGASILQFILFVGLNWVFLVKVKFGVGGIFMASLISMTVFLLVLTLGKEPLSQPSVSFSHLHLLLLTWLAYIPVTCGDWTLNFVDRYFVNRYAGTEELAFYGVGYLFGYLLTILIYQPFLSVWSVVVFSIGELPDGRRIFQLVFRYITAFSLLVALGLTLFAGPAIRYLLHPKFLPGLPVVLPVCVSYLLYGVYCCLHVGLLLKRKYHFLSWLYVACAATNIGLNLVLTPPLGMIGAALARLGAFALLASLSAWISQRLYPFPIGWSRVARLVIPAVLLGGIDCLIPDVPGIVPVLRKAVMVMIYPVTVYLIGGITREDFLTLAELFRKSGQRGTP